MTMLGAQLDDLHDLSAHLTAMATDVASCRDDAVSTTTQVIADVTQATALALQQINAHMSHLETTVHTAVGRADAAQWTGANAERFRQGAADFQASMSTGQATTRETFAAFQQSAAMMTETLQDFVAGFSSALTDASGSANDMAAAVEAQRSNLDTVMNLGLSIG